MVWFCFVFFSFSLLAVALPYMAVIIKILFLQDFFLKSWMYVWTLSNSFSVSIEMIVLFMSLRLLIKYIAFYNILIKYITNLYMLNQPCTFGMNPAWLWCANYYVLALGLSECWETFLLCSSRRMMYSFLSLRYPHLVLISEETGLVLFSNAFSPVIWWKSLTNMGVRSSLKVW